MNDRCRVVLVDDADDLRTLLSARLRRDGRFEIVGEARDGQEAIAVTAAVAPNVVVLDLAMPVMDGLTALPHLLDGQPGLKVVVLSGFAADEFGERALELGAHLYLEKGVAFDDLAESLAAVCGVGV